GVAEGHRVRNHSAVEEAAIPGRSRLRHVLQLGGQAGGKVSVDDLRQARDQPLVADADLDQEQRNHRRAAPLVCPECVHQWLIVPATLPTLSSPTSPSMTLAKLCETNG